MRTSEPLDDIHALNGAISIPMEATPDPAWLWIVLIPMAVVAAAAWLFARCRRRERTAPAAELARTLIGDAEARMRAGEPADAAAVLQAAVREYLETRCDLPTGSRSAHELANLLQVTAALRAGGDELAIDRHGRRLVRLMSVCEGVAFGDDPIGEAEWAELTATFERFVDERERELQEIPR